LVEGKTILDELAGVRLLSIGGKRFDCSVVMARLSTTILGFPYLSHEGYRRIRRIMPVVDRDSTRLIEWHLALHYERGARIETVCFVGRVLRASAFG
jgi:hypothetical protein